jgi:hypothetical protein
MSKNKKVLFKTHPLMDINIDFIDKVIRTYISSRPFIKYYPSITGKEHSYVFKIKDPFLSDKEIRRNDLEIKLLTSIKVNSGKLAVYGEDSIKIIVVDSITRKIVYKFPRIYRTNTNHVVGKIIAYLDKAVEWVKRIPLCKECGSPMTLLKTIKKGDKTNVRYFWGCVRYPLCKQKQLFKGEKNAE